MISALANHIWQSTLVALALGCLTLAFLRNRAEVRHWLWFSASVKFLIPFALLVGLGNRIDWKPAPAYSAPPVVTAIIEPATELFPNTGTTPHTPEPPRDWTIFVLCLVWACGFAAIASVRFREWRRMRAAIRSSQPNGFLEGIPVRHSTELPEPGIIGLLRPVLLLPHDLHLRLNRAECDAVLAHELCHVRRRDNLSSALHIVVEAIFWFHPLVWFIGARLLAERERACDEAVLRRGMEPRDYAEAILKICRSCLERRLSFASGVAGADLRARIPRILSGTVGDRLSTHKRLTLAALAIAALTFPVVIGAYSAPPRAPQTTSDSNASSPAAIPKIASISVRRCDAFRPNTPAFQFPGNTLSGCTTVERYIQQAYGLFAKGHMHPLSSANIAGGPDWVATDLYDIEFHADAPQQRALMNGPMLQAVLEDKFQLSIHSETRPAPVFILKASDGAARLAQFRGQCTPFNFDHPDPGAIPEQCGTARFTPAGLDIRGANIADLQMFLLVTLHRPVIDATGLRGRYDLHLQLSTQDFNKRPHSLPALSNPADPEEPALVSDIKTAIGRTGLKLEPAEGTREFLVIDHISRPGN